MIKVFKSMFITITAMLVTFAAPASTYALTEAQLDFYAQNNILFYDPGIGWECVMGNQNYAGATVWLEAELSAIEANRPFYEKAASQYNFPWQILAVLHSHENSLRRSNPRHFQTDAWAAKDPENTLSEGPFGLHSWALSGRVSYLRKDSLTDEEFQQAVNDAAQFIVESYPGIDLNSPDGVKRLFFRYNGAAQVYIDKAVAMGFTEEQARNGEGSMYVMNRYDAQRDPANPSTMSSLWPGRFVNDGKYDPTNTSNGFGAFVQYEALAGSSYCSNAGDAIAEMAISLSWEGENSHAKNDPKPEYVEAMKEIGFYIQGNGYYPEGASCDQFVGTVMRYSGVDPDFPVFFGYGLVEYLKTHTDMYMKVEHNNDVANLQPGDIFITYENGNHIYLYVGEIDGKQYQASASANTRTGEHFPLVYFNDNYGKNGDGTRYYEVYRRINY